MLMQNSADQHVNVCVLDILHLYTQRNTPGGNSDCCHCSTHLSVFGSTVLRCNELFSELIRKSCRFAAFDVFHWVQCAGAATRRQHDAASAFAPQKQTEDPRVGLFGAKCSQTLKKEHWRTLMKILKVRLVFFSLINCLRRSGERLCCRRLF